MTFSSLCYPECGVARPSPVTGPCNEPCVRQCSDSEVVIRPSPVVVTLPGPILSNFPQHSGVGAVGAPAVASSFGGSFSWGGSGHYGYGGLLGHGGYGGYPGLYGYGGLWGYGGYGCSYGGLYGLGGYGGYGHRYRLCGYGALGSYLGGYGYGGLCGSKVSCHRYLSGSCGPC
ncbi:claw keratin-like [Gopherus flavomarginatus]|uniref:claw keratin-like n=1 Tax=Gopherus flavomarginatus TaxID=286002 RepID=UPI0021CBE988|nr:claw keratin-like [Gopherus flavomarginatus]